jgi:ribonuclease P protein subunit POP4
MATDAVFQDQRKRTLEALERRFAVEHLLQQKKNKKSLNKVDNKEHNSKGSSFIASVVDKTDAAVTPTLGASSKKGVFFLFFKAFIPNFALEDLPFVTRKKKSLRIHYQAC